MEKSNRKEDTGINQIRVLALEIIKLHGGFKTPKETAGKYNEILEVLNNHCSSKGCAGVAIGETSEEVIKDEEVKKPKEQNVIRIAKALVEAGFTVLKYDCCPSGELAIELKVIPSHLLEDKIKDS